jgi:hypothetical protein
MTSTIWLPLRAEQVRTLMEHHKHEAAHATTLPARHDHLRDADDLQRRLSDFEERTEARDERAA